MSDIKLTKAELAALDLLIDSMQSSERLTAGAVEARFTPALRRVIKVLAKVTPVIAETVGLTQQEATGQRLDESARDITPGITLDTLIELRQRAKED